MEADSDIPGRGDTMLNLGYNELTFLVKTRYSLRSDFLRFLCKVPFNRSLLLLRDPSRSDFSPTSI